MLFNKPWGVLSQFTSEAGHPSLAQYLDISDVYPAGRLDRDSEGLLVLTDDGRLQARISSPRFKMPKTYWAQLEGAISQEAVHRLSRGVTLKDGPTLPARCHLIDPPDLWPRDPPIRFRRNIPTSWIELSIKEGRNRQVRRMTAVVGFPTLRLVRVALGPWQLGDLAPGQWIVVPATPELESPEHVRSGKPS